MKFCAACSMPLENETLIGLEKDDQSFCAYCVNEEKTVKSCEEIFEGGVQFFLSLDPSFTRSFAEKNVRKNMHSLPYWKNNTAPCLQGEIASDEEFAQILARLQG
ncbi:zinc ribbon domain-containing protein [Azotosporobacter soli]|uniref:zinc ribbon domain-containing protein n=1 Tax=Azotosporobacter soli TaxID=3055040 RepID=UPI0031FF0EA8